MLLLIDLCNNDQLPFPQDTRITKEMQITCFHIFQQKLFDRGLKAEFSVSQTL